MIKNDLFSKASVGFLLFSVPLTWKNSENTRYTDNMSCDFLGCLAVLRIFGKYIYSDVRSECSADCKQLMIGDFDGGGWLAYG
ncbi:hypothetical protein S2091_1497 [Solimicrobium silvestre]|uniref:Uncharacterized protein n=1 Tax=Solimicrobium silvestre TaxID=2099400 RepID=A0A2S9H1P7_9BURK|nr:hypothetical protein S2091_1497 [Solimicrobium silvestre]